MTSLEFLRAARRRLIEKLAPEDVAEFDRIERALDQWSAGPQRVTPNEFAGLQIIDAVRLYLARIGHPVAASELVEALVAAGVGADGGERAPTWKIRQSLGYHLAKSRLSGSMDGEIGLPEWTEQAEPPSQNK